MRSNVLTTALALLLLFYAFYAIPASAQDGYNGNNTTATNNASAFTSTTPSRLPESQHLEIAVDTKGSAAFVTIPAIAYTAPARASVIDIDAALGKFKWAAQKGIYYISTGLLYPVIIMLFILIGWSLIAIGSFLYEWRARSRDFASFERGAFKARALLNANELDDAFSLLGTSCSNKFVHDFLRRLSEFRGVLKSKKLVDVKVEKLLQDFETEMSKRVEKSRFVTRAGPMLGLMGTLIPMGPALLALAGGDVKTLANNLIIAFGSTVLGLATGLIGHMVSMVRSRWYEQDMSDMEYLSEILFGEGADEEGLELGIEEGLEKKKAVK